MTKYPAALDELSTSATNETESKNVHPALHNEANSAINKIEAELGVEPSKSYPNVAAYLTSISEALEVLAPISASGKVKTMGANLVPTIIYSGETTSGSKTLKMAGTNGLSVGMAISATNIPTGTTIASVTNSTEVTMSAEATGTATGLTLTARSLLANPPTITQAAATTYTGTPTQHFHNWTGFRRSTSDYGSSNQPLGPTATRIVAETTNASKTVKVNYSAGLGKGLPISGAGIPAGATVETVPTSTEITISAAATATASGVTLVAKTYFSGNYRVEFDSWAPSFEMKVFAGSNAKYRIWVNEVPMTPVPVAYPSITSAQAWVKFNWGNAAYRRIILEFEGSGGYPQFSGLYHEPKYSIFRPQIPSAKLIDVGDSGLYGVGAENAAHVFGLIAGRLIGIANVTNVHSVGGVGFVTPSATSAMGPYSDRLESDVIPALTEAVAEGVRPILVLHGTLNDANPWSEKKGTVAPAVTSYVEIVRANVPGVRIVLTSPWFMGEPTAEIKELDAELKAVAATLKLAYVDLLTETANPTLADFNGNGKSGEVGTVEGNAYLFRATDGTHPSAIGHPVLAERYAPRLAAALGIDY